MSIRPAAVLAGLMVASFLGVGGSPTLALCAGVLPGSSSTPVQPALAFVGTVTATSDQDRTAAVHVDEVWTGQHIPPEVIMHGSPDVGAAATSVDRHYQNGHRYLFVPANASGPPYEDDACSATREFTPSVAATRPNSVIHYPPAPSSLPLVPLAAAGIAILAALLYTLFRLR